MLGAVALSLFEDDIDRDATIKAAKNLLKHGLKQYLYRCGRSRLDLSSPVLDPTGVSSHGGSNHQEDTMVINLNSERALIAIGHAISNCSNTPRRPYKQILCKSYIKEYSGKLIYGGMGYSKSYFYKLRDDALVEFAQLLEYWKAKDHADIPSTLKMKKGHFVDT